MNLRRLLLKEKGTSLIELLTIVVLIAILSNLAIVQWRNIMESARDKRRQADLAGVQEALIVFYGQNQRMPGNYNCCGSFCTPTDPRPHCAACNAGTGMPAYMASMKELSDDHLLGDPPQGPGKFIDIGIINAGSQWNYCYYDYGPNSGVGAVLYTVLEKAAPSTTGIPPSTRFWPASGNWCSKVDATKEYCLTFSY